MTDPMTDPRPPEPRCVRCGHSSGYHGATFCVYQYGANHHERHCDCSGWSDTLNAARPPEQQEPTYAIGHIDGAHNHNPAPVCGICRSALRLWRQKRLAARAGQQEPSGLRAHPGEPHEFRTVCGLCGENGYLNIALITDGEVVKIEPRAALAEADAGYGGKGAAVGTKASPGPLHGIANDVWAALAVGVTYLDREENR